MRRPGRRDIDVEQPHTYSVDWRPGSVEFAIDGATGNEHFMIPTAITWSINPAIGDIDGDWVDGGARRLDVPDRGHALPDDAVRVQGGPVFARRQWRAPEQHEAPHTLVDQRAC